MKDADFNILVAELAGWWPHPDNDNGGQKFWTFGGYKYGDISCRWAADPSASDDRCMILSLPDYLNDLNYMYKALLTLNEWIIGNYINHLSGIVEDDLSSSTSVAQKVLLSSARQQAEAFVLTLKDMPFGSRL